MKHSLDPCEEAFVHHFKKVANHCHATRENAISVVQGIWDDESAATDYIEYWKAFKAGWRANKKAKKGEGSA